ncbi:DUF2057 domain-containing protein [Gallibacterium anatis]|uniref:UPF0319 protein UMN179_00283 n=3 Tax=Gallibacterium anatis TaxID=750 RepID=F4HBG3_GALAU|nr:DUF2057 domain-containing protein [Gallibacterium anatis]AEC16320.1 hypothetical protein UMN179_00283 [Gallibacterium anatis UMN179]KGQ24428.1 hypothetical protein JP33_08780 [Gallibacterium anatis CCM5995]KGQ34924.1 hypothetical protein JP34_06105 [Gallibacterium anatis]KGQ40335.1 hypothetical protein JP30_07865 [Gallibacterium anatis IPDH697-78]KGQ41163.1 hypothetical protein JP35_01505 [Gallibacterium anatis]
MKLSRFALACVAATLSMSSLAATVTVTPNISLLAIDGEKAKSSLTKSQNSFNINDNNKHQVVVRVSEVVDNGSDKTLFESDPIIVTFQAGNQDLVISAPRLDNMRNANMFAKDPKITVKTSADQTVASKQDILKQTGIFPDTRIAEDLAEYNASQGVAAVPNLVSVSMPAAIPTAAGAKATKAKITVQGENVAEQMLQYWYQQADKETQARFLKWAQGK